MQATLLPEPDCERARADSLLLAAVTRRLFQRLLPPLWLTFFACYISRNNIAFAGPDGMDGDLHLSKADYGLASGLFFAGYAILQLPCTHVSQAVGVNRMIGAAVFFATLSSAAMGCVQGKGAIYVLRFLIGVTEAPVAPVTMLYLSYNLPSDAAVSSAVAVWGTASGIGYAFTSSISGPLVQWLDGVGGYAGWRWLFWVQGAPGLVSVLLVLTTLPSHAPDATWLTDDERRVLRAALVRPPAEEHVAERTTAGSSTRREGTAASMRSSHSLASSTRQVMRHPLFYAYSLRVFVDCAAMYAPTRNLPHACLCVTYDLPHPCLCGSYDLPRMHAFTHAGTRCSSSCRCRSRRPSRTGPPSLPTSCAPPRHSSSSSSPPRLRSAWARASRAYSSARLARWPARSSPSSPRQHACSHPTVAARRVSSRS